MKSRVFLTALLIAAFSASDARAARLPANIYDYQ